MAEKVVRRTTAKKTVRKTSGVTTATRTPARRSTVSSVRKAPTELRSSTSVSRGKTHGKTFIIGLIFFVVLLGVSALIGYSDKGQLNVEATIAKRIQSATPEEQESLKDVPIQQQQTVVPNGGLVGMGQSAPPPPPEPVSTTTDSTATSTEETASSTSQAEEENTADESTEPELAQ